jgi:hypothetical protein
MPRVLGSLESSESSFEGGGGPYSPLVDAKDLAAEVEMQRLARRHSHPGNLGWGYMPSPRLDSRRSSDPFPLGPSDLVLGASITDVGHAQIEHPEDGMPLLHLPSGILSPSPRDSPGVSVSNSPRHRRIAQTICSWSASSSPRSSFKRGPKQTSDALEVVLKKAL